MQMDRIESNRIKNTLTINPCTLYCQIIAEKRLLVAQTECLRRLMHALSKCQLNKLSQLFDAFCRLKLKTLNKCN